MNADLSRDLFAALARPLHWHFVTVNPDGSPQVSPVAVLTRGELIVVNTLKHRQKAKNALRDPRVALSWIDPVDPYYGFIVAGNVVAVIEGQEAEDDLDRVGQKYFDQEVYPYREEGDVRVSFDIEPRRVRRTT